MLSQTPAIADSLPGYDISSWTGIGLPAGTPKEIVSKLTLEIRAIMQTPEWKQLISSNGVEVSQLTAAEFAQRIAMDYEKFGRVIQAANIKAE
jgi:tripartite-type tricarboxylate transporter receptor subunit TctC